jgi:hypothetical protein
MANALIIFHVQDPTGAPIGGALLSSVGGPGPWQGLTNPCGDFIAQLAPAHYDITISKAGFVMRELPADLADCGIVTIGLEVGVPPFQVAPRTFAGNMCGIRLPGLPPVPGGSADPSLVLSWFYGRYTPDDRARIRAAWKARGYLDVLLSWPDDRAVGASPEAFRALCVELIADGFRPCPMLTSKAFDPADAPAILSSLAPLLPLLKELVARVCIGWELSLWLSPTQVQQLIDALAPQFTSWGCRVYVHFQQGFFAFQQPGGVTADFWNKNVGKLTGVLHQRDLSWDKPMYQARIVDCLQRFAGQFGFTRDSGFGHPFDFIALEITAHLQFIGEMSEAEGDSWGRTALTTPPVEDVRVMGSGNGF